MKAISWNCRGLNSVDSTKLPYVLWLMRVHSPTLLFLSETKMSVSLAANMFSFSNPTFCTGVNAIGASGGLLVLGWANLDVRCVLSSPNFVLCKIMENSINISYIMFIYGAPLIDDRNRVWDQVLDLLILYPTCLILGDFNQVEWFEDKLGGSPFIRGWDDFVQFRLQSRLLEVPFS